MCKGPGVEKMLADWDAELKLGQRIWGMWAEGREPQVESGAWIMLGPGNFIPCEAEKPLESF